MKKGFGNLWIVILLLFPGCAHRAPVAYFSQPEVRQASRETYDARIEPLKLDNPFYVAFQLTVANKSSRNLEIDWDRTRYLFGGRDYGRFVFQGIDPESVKSGIPRESVPAGGTLTREIYPIKTLGFKGWREAHKSGESNFYPTKLPNGTQTVELSIVQGDRQWKEPLSVRIGSRQADR